jgi:hypothetical protein
LCGSCLTRVPGLLRFRLSAPRAPTTPLVPGAVGARQRGFHCTGCKSRDSADSARRLAHFVASVEIHSLLPILRRSVDTAARADGSVP